MITTLDELISFIDESETVPAAQKPHLRSAVNRMRTLVCDGLSDTRADRRVALRRLDLISPATAKMTPQSLANLKSRVRAAYRHAAPDLAPARSHVRLKGEWQALEALLAVREQRALSRLLRFAQAVDWRPQDINDERVEQYARYLQHEVMLTKAESVIRGTRRAWNRAVDTVPGWPDRRLTLLSPKRQPYWLRREQLPVSLQQEMATWLDRLANPDPFLGESCRNFAAATIRQYRDAFIQLASALVASGTPVEKLTSAATLVRPDNLEQALRYLYARAGDRVNVQIYTLAYKARKIAAHAGLPERDLARIDRIWASVRREAPVRYGLTDTNRHLLNQLDDAEFVDRLVSLPYRLMDAAKRMTASRHAASCARDAVASELLISCSMRLGNLVDLQVGTSIRRFGEGAQARWVVDIPVEKVKNRVPLRYALLPESGRLIEWYLAEWQHHWCGAGAVWLFPAKDGGHVDPILLSRNIARRAHRYVGARITAHQFRHLAAELYLQEDPMGLGVVSQHLGHRKFDTTRKYYCREQTRIATQRYHELLARKRAQATSRRGRPKQGRQVP